MLPVLADVAAKLVWDPCGPHMLATQSFPLSSHLNPPLAHLTRRLDTLTTGTPDRYVVESRSTRGVTRGDGEAAPKVPVASIPLCIGNLVGGRVGGGLRWEERGQKIRLLMCGSHINSAVTSAKTSSNTALGPNVT